METPFRFEAAGGTLFVVTGDQVEVLRSDQPVWKGPLADLVQFAEQVRAAT